MAEEVPSELVIVETPAAIVEADPGMVVAALENYQSIQVALDRSMPDCIITIQGKPFRKKKYWRAIATAFNLRLELVSEQRHVIEGKPISLECDVGNDWGYHVVYRATASNGRLCDGDGACYASEKLNQDGWPTAMMTEHVVRAHAHTRAKNRAIADLVGFGEVSADEVQREKPEPKPRKSMAQATRDTEPANQNALTPEDIKKLGDAVVANANRLFNDSVDREIGGAPQSEGAMEEALKKAAFIYCDSKPTQHDTVEHYVRVFAMAVVEADGSIVFIKKAA